MFFLSQPHQPCMFLPACPLPCLPCPVSRPRHVLSVCSVQPACHCPLPKMSHHTLSWLLLVCPTLILPCQPCPPLLSHCPTMCFSLPLPSCSSQRSLLRGNAIHEESAKRCHICQRHGRQAHVCLHICCCFDTAEKPCARFCFSCHFSVLPCSFHSHPATHVTILHAFLLHAHEFC